MFNSDSEVQVFWNDLVAEAKTIVKKEPVLEDIMNKQVMF